MHVKREVVLIFSFVFFFDRSMQIRIKILTGSIQEKEIEYFTFSYLHGSWLFILWFHCEFCNEKKGTFESLFMLPKGKCICMLRGKFCVANFRFLTNIILFVFVFFSFCNEKKEHLGFLLDLAISKRQRRRVEIWP
jgi:hypothetical protein